MKKIAVCLPFVVAAFQLANAEGSNSLTSIEGTGLLSAHAPSLAGASTESIEGTGLRSLTPQSIEGSGLSGRPVDSDPAAVSLNSIEGTGIQAIIPQSIEGTGLPFSAPQQTTPAALSIQSIEGTGIQSSIRSIEGSGIATLRSIEGTGKPHLFRGGDVSGLRHDESGIGTAIGTVKADANTPAIRRDFVSHANNLLDASSRQLMRHRESSQIEPAVKASVEMPSGVGGGSEVTTHTVRDPR